MGMMIKWQFDKKDASIIFLIKTMKRKYVDDTMKKGKLCFNVPTRFNSSNDLNPAQFDKWDSYSASNVQEVMFWPILSETESGITYGEKKLLAKRATIREISDVSQYTPMCCFRRVLEEDFIDCENGSILKLGDIVDRIKTEFGHDSYILVLQPGDMLNRIGKISTYFARRIHYGDKDPEYQEFLDKYDFCQTEMFQKREEYAWQKEFRIILPKQDSTDPQMLYIGSIEDIAIAGNIEELRNGLLIAEEANSITRAVSIIKHNVG